MANAGLRIHAFGRNARVVDTRPQISALFLGRDAEAVLALIPSLLPVCANAQRIAAERAVEAARGHQEQERTRQTRDAELLREQALAAAWRLLVDWPRALGKAPSLTLFKHLRNSDNEVLAEQLEVLLPESLRKAATSADLKSLFPATPGGARTVGTSVPEQLLAPLDAQRLQPEPGELTAASVPELTALPAPELTTFPAPELMAFPAPELMALSAPEQHRRALNACLEPDDVTTSPAEKALAELRGSLAVTVGPLAMARDALISTLTEQSGFSAVDRLLWAALLDTRALAKALRRGAIRSQGAASQGGLDSRSGWGRSDTARGPLYHCVSLNEDGCVRRWTYLAPTDWHFAPGGLVESLLPTCADLDAARRLVLAADPCAPWEFVDSDEPGRRAA